MRKCWSSLNTLAKHKPSRQHRHRLHCSPLNHPLLLLALYPQGPEDLWIYSPAALPHMQGVLSVGTPLPLLDAAHVTPEQLVDRLPRLLRSSADVQDLTPIPFELVKLACLTFAALLEEAGVDMTARACCPPLGWQAAPLTPGWSCWSARPAIQMQCTQRWQLCALWWPPTGFLCGWRPSGTFSWGCGSSGATRVLSPPPAMPASILVIAYKKLGGGDEAKGARIYAAMDDWQERLTAVGAGPLAGIMPPSKGTEAQLCASRQQWRSRVEEGWPEATGAISAPFDAALAAGASLQQLASRFSSASYTKNPWSGDVQQASEEVREAYVAASKKKKPRRQI